MGRRSRRRRQSTQRETRNERTKQEKEKKKRIDSPRAHFSTPSPYTIFSSFFSFFIFFFVGCFLVGALCDCIYEMLLDARNLHTHADVHTCIAHIHGRSVATLRNILRRVREYMAAATHTHSLTHVRLILNLENSMKARTNETNEMKCRMNERTKYVLWQRRRRRQRRKIRRRRRSWSRSTEERMKKRRKKRMRVCVSV